jgi:hypothetical protein
MAGQPRKNHKIKYPDLFEEFVKYYGQFRTGNPADRLQEEKCIQPEDMAAHEEMMMQFLRCFVLGDPEKEKKLLSIIWEDVVGILQKRAGNSETEMSDFMRNLFDCSTPEEFFNELFAGCPK